MRSFIPLLEFLIVLAFLLRAFWPRLKDRFPDLGKSFGKKAGYQSVEPDPESGKTFRPTLSATPLPPTWWRTVLI